MAIKKFDIRGLDTTANVKVLISSDLANIQMGNLYVDRIFFANGDPFLSGGGGSASITVSNTAPFATTTGSLWFNSDSGQLFVYYNDGDSTQWIMPIGGEGPVGATGPTGLSSDVTVVANVIYANNTVLAANTFGNDLVTVTGANFKDGAKIFIDKQEVNVGNVQNTSITFTAPANAAGYYHLFVYNTDGTSGMKPLGMFYSTPPSWISNSNIGITLPNTAFITNVVATGDVPLVYDFWSGNIPTGITVASNGRVSGSTANVDGLYQFNIRVRDAQLQPNVKSFTIEVNSGFTVEYLIVAGGGGGGNGNNTSGAGGGGGAGGLLQGNIRVAYGTNYSVIVGAGGSGGGGATNGGDSSFRSQVALGGGSGGNGDGANGGSGGGGNWGGIGGLGTPGQGYGGGSGSLSGGAGGGAGGSGNPSGGNFTRPAGGPGVTSSISGSAVTYAAGGHGGQNDFSCNPATGASSSTGNGGGGGCQAGGGVGNGAGGGSGIVIIRYLAPQRATGGSLSTSGGYIVHTYTSSDTFVTY